MPGAKGGDRMPDALSIEQLTARLQGRKHRPELQAFRGLAALTVLVHHCTFFYEYPSSERAIAAGLFNAHAAVVSFFVLSGLVLSGSMLDREMSLREIAAFYSRRAFRIYPALWVACLFGGAYVVFNEGVSTLPENASQWARNGNDTTGLTARDFVLALASIKGNIPVPIWTLLVELIGSAIMPLLVLAFLRGVKSFIMATLFLVVLAVASLPAIGGIGFIFRYYLVYFAFGISIRLWAPYLAKMKRSAAFATLALSFGCLWFGRYLIGASLENDYHNVWASLIEGASATVLIGLIYAKPGTFSLLRTRSLVWLGDVSYSLYLVHLSLLLFIAAMGGTMLKLAVFTASPYTALVALVVCTLGTTLVVSALIYRFVELPGMELGKRVTRRLLG